MVFRIIGENVKIHWSFNDEVALQVAQDLETRFNAGPQVLEDNRRNYVFWTPVVTYNIADEPFFRFLLDGCEIRVRLQHWFEFKNLVKNGTLRKSSYTGPFYKIHGDIHVICLSQQQKESLLLQISEKSEEYDGLTREHCGYLRSFYDDAQGVE